jgi:uncharacterized protein (DUF2249 family)
MNSGNIRVISLRKGCYTHENDETVIRVDRKNPVLGNNHILHNQHDEKERQQVIAAYIADSEIDYSKKGPRYWAIVAIAKKVAQGKSVALACWCSPRCCHGDWIAKKVLEEVQQIKCE